MSDLVSRNKIPPGSFRALIDTDEEYDQIKNQPHILFGTGCNNIHVVKLIGECTSIPDIDEDKGMIIRFDNKYLIIANNDDGLRAITDYIAKNSLNGNKIVAD